MLRKLLSVGGFTLLSRVTGFARDIILAAVLGERLQLGEPHPVARRHRDDQRLVDECVQVVCSELSCSSR